MEIYQKAKIYILRSNYTKNVYIGSTCQKLSSRKSNHKRDYNSFKSNKCNYITSFEIIKYEDCYIELIENYPCNSKEELLRREGELIRSTENTVNKCIAGRTYKEWYADNFERIAKVKKEWKTNNKEKCKNNEKIWRNNNKERCQLNKQQYYIDNKDTFNLRNKEWYISTGKALAQKKKDENKDKYKCYCCEFKTYELFKLKRHNKTIKHKTNFNNYCYKYALKLGASKEIAKDLLIN